MIDTAIIALIGTVFGGAGLKTVETFLTRGQKKTDEAAILREELRKEATSLREELRAVEKELDSWKEKYFLLLQEYLELKGKLLQQPEHKENDW
jgi:GrpB-like predicted nucleotidyltransferase (UPF0157 family)